MNILLLSAVRWAFANGWSLVVLLLVETLVVRGGEGSTRSSQNAMATSACSGMVSRHRHRKAHLTRLIELIVLLIRQVDADA